MRAVFFALLAAAMFPLPASAQDVSTLLHRQTQEFSDAGQHGNGGAMAKYLDDGVIFFNEGGDRATKADMSQNGAPAPGVNRTIKTTDWDCKVHGDVAVTSFIDVVEQGPPGERQMFKYRSVETWLKEKSGWKMIGSETLALAEDPPAIALDSKMLDEYAGRYEASPDMKITFVHKGQDLVAALNGGPSTAQKAQARDIVFTPGHAQTPKVFQRDARGRITGFVYLRGSHSLTFRRLG